MSCFRPLVPFMVLLMFLPILMPIPAAMPQPLQMHTLQGVLTYEFGDNPDHTISPARFFLSVGETRTELLFDTRPWSGYLGRQVIVQGTPLNVQGVAESAIQVSSISLPMGLEAAPPRAVTGTRDVILLLVKFSGDTQTPHAQSWYTDTVFNPATGNTVNNFYEASSWGVFGWHAVATTWMILPHSKTYYAPHNDWTHSDADVDALFDDAVALGETNGVDFSLYDNIAIVTNNDLDCCAWGGTAWYNGKLYGVVWEPPWSAEVSVFAHELGHSIGLDHSGWVYYAYDSPWDVMSNGMYHGVTCGSYKSANTGGTTSSIYCYTPADIIAPYKDVMGWIDSPHLLTVAAGSPATAQVDTLAAPLSGSKKMVKICVAGKDCTTGGATAQYYTVEARTHYTSSPGFDYYLEHEGVIIHYYWGNWPGPIHNSCYFNYQYGPAYPIDNFNVVPAPHYNTATCSETISGQKRGLYYANWNDGQTYTATGISIAIASHDTVPPVTTYTVVINGGGPSLTVTATSPANGATVTSSPVTLEADVTGSGPIQDATVTIRVGGASVCSGNSDVNGHYSCSYVLTQSGHTYSWYATASKSGYAPGTSPTRSFTYQPPPQLSVALISPGNGASVSSPVELKARVTYHAAAVSGATVHFYINGVEVASSASLPTGYASYVYSAPSLASYSWYATAEKAGYNAGTSVTRTFTISAIYVAAITGVSVVPDAAHVGQGSKMTFTVTAANTGPSDIASAIVKVKIYKPGPVLAATLSKPIAAFLHGSSRSVDVVYTLAATAPTGGWTYDAYLYRLTTILDDDTGHTFTVEPRVIAGTIISVADAPDPVTHGTTATFTVTFRNTGNIVWSSARITVKVYKPGGTVLATQRMLTVMNVAPGVDYTRNLTWLVPATYPKVEYPYTVTLTYLTTTVATSPGHTITVN